MSKQETNWRNWGDHPVVVIITVVSAIISIVVFFVKTDKPKIKTRDYEYKKIECMHKAHEHDSVTCQHPQHPAGDRYLCSHQCIDYYYGYPIPCHPGGDILPCSHPLHAYDPTPCIHLAHPDGDIIKSN